MELELEAEERPNAYLFLFFCRAAPAGFLAYFCFRAARSDECELWSFSKNGLKFWNTC